MAAPQSGQLPLSLPNNSQPIAEVDVPREKGGSDRLQCLITHAWRMFFSSTVQTSDVIDPAWTATVSNPPTQAQVTAIRDQVMLISQLLGRPT